jgi:hypothetical protein
MQEVVSKNKEINHSDILHLSFQPLTARSTPYQLQVVFSSYSSSVYIHNGVEKSCDLFDAYFISLKVESMMQCFEVEYLQTVAQLMCADRFTLYAQI